MISAYRFLRAYLLSVILIGSTSSLATPREPEKPLIVVVEKAAPLFEQSTGSAPRGLLVDFWNHWSKNTGIPISFAGVKAGEAIERLRCGEADIALGVTYHPSMAEDLLYSRPFFELPLSIYYRRALVKPPNTLEDLAELRVGILKGSGLHSEIESHLPDNKRKTFKPPTEYANGILLIEAAIKGEIDAFVLERPFASEYLARLDAFKKIRQAPVPAIIHHLYVAVRAGETPLFNRVNQGMDSISAKEFSDIALPSCADIWIYKKEDAPKRVVIVCSSGSAPFQFTDEKGEPVGMIIDLWKLWSERTGIAVEFRPVPWGKTLEMLRSGEADIHAGLFYSEERDTYTDYTAALFKSETHTFYYKGLPSPNRLKDLLPYRVGMIEGDFAENYFQQKAPEVDLKIYPSNQGLFDAVERGDIRVFVKDTPIAIHHLSMRGLLDQYHYSAENPLYSNIFYAGVKEGDHLLLSVVARGMQAITPKERAAISRKWMNISESKDEDILTIALPRNYAPLASLSRRGIPSGLLVDIWRLWSEKTNRKIEFRTFAREECALAVQRGDADILGGDFRPEELGDGLLFSQSIYTITSGFFHLRSSKNISSIPSLSGQRVGAVAGSYLEDDLRHGHPNLTIVPYPTSGALIEAAQRGEIAAWLDEIPVMDSLLDELGEAGAFQRLPEIAVTRNLHSAVRIEENALLELVDRGLSEITRAELAELESRWIEYDSQVAQVIGTEVHLTASEEEWLRNHTRIRIGVDPDYAPYSFRNANGAYRGVAMELMNEVSALLGVELEVVPDLSWPEILAGVRDKTLDLVVTAKETEPRKEFMAFSKPYLSTPLVVMSRKDDPSIQRDADLSGKTVALVRKYSSTEEILQTHPDIIPLMQETLTDTLRAVSEGKADASVGVAGINLYQLKRNAIPNLKVACRYGTTINAQSLGVRKDWPELASILNKALDSIPEEKVIEAFDQWIPSSSKIISGLLPIQLTAEEQKWLKEHPLIHVGVDPDWSPIEFRDKKGEFQGVSIEYLQALEQMLGITFEPVKDCTWQQLHAGVKEGTVDMFSSLSITPDRAKTFNFTNPYLSIPVAIFTRVEEPYIGSLKELEGRTVAVVQDYAVGDWLKRDWPKIKLAALPTTKLALEALKKEKVDAVVGDLMGTGYYLKEKSYYNTIKVGGETPYRNDQTMAIRKDWPILSGILQKGLDAIPETMHESFLQKWVSITYEYSFDRSLYWKIGIPILLLLLFILGWNYLLHTEILLRKATEIQLKEANQAKSEFLANMSHEIRTPMNSVLGFAEILKRKETDPKKSHYIDNILTSGKALLNLINDILDISKVEAGKIELQYSSIALTHLFQELETIFSQKAKDKGIKLSTVLPEELPAALVMDETRVRQILINLLGNAIKFTKQGTISLEAECHFPEGTHSEVQLEIRVRDSGIGIPPEQLAHIFDAFEQTKEQKVKQYGGTGLGLTISKRLVELMGGSLSVESTEGQGSTFTIRIPQVDLAAARLGESVKKIHPADVEFNQATILIADDIDYNREILETFLSEFNFTFLMASNGKEALAQIHEHHPDLILLDIKMPEMDGYEVIRRLSEDPSVSSIPVIAVTASALSTDVTALSKLCDGCLPKPVTREQLIRELIRHLPHTASKATAPSILTEKKNEWPEMIEALAPDLRDQLYQAALDLDAGLIESLLENYDDLPKELVNKIEGLTRRFDFEQLLDLL